MRGFSECGVAAWMVLFVSIPPVAMGAGKAVKSVAPSPTADKASGKEMPAAGPFAGVVVEMGGNPAPGATVWLLNRGEPGEAVTVAETTCDNKGRFRIARLKSHGSAGHASFFVWTARDSKGRIGGQVRSYREFEPGAAAPADSNRDVRIVLQNVRDYHGHLLDAAGKPIAKASIRLRSCWNVPSPQGYSGSMLVFPPKLNDELATKSGGGGSFTLRWLPLRGWARTAVRAEGFGKPEVRLNLEQSATVRLSRSGTIRGTAVCPENPKAAAGVHLVLDNSNILRSPAPQGQPLPAYEIFYSERTTTRNDGTFEIDGVPAGKHTVTTTLSRPRIPPDRPIYSERAPAVEVKPGETASVALVLHQAARVQGRVLDEQTGEGIADVSVFLMPTGRSRAPYFAADEPFRQPNGTISYRTPRSDAAGRFAFFAPLGKVAIQYQYRLTGGGYQIASRAYPRRVEVEIKGDTTLETLRLPRVKLSGLEGLVVNRSGKPVAGAKIVCTSVSMNDHFFPGRDIRTDRNGKFSFESVTPKMRLNVRARTSRAAAEPVNVAMSQQKGPVRLVLDEKTSCTAKGIAADDDGKPLPNAKIELIINLWFGDHGTSFGCETGTTDAAGKFQIGGLWAGDSYEIRASATGCETRGTKSITATVGGTIDFGKIALRSISGVVQGKVVDSSGKPLAGVHVFNSGDAPTPIDTRSGADGKFRLAGLRKGTVYVSAEKDGYRFSGLKTAAGVSDAVLKMLRSEEPPPKWSTPPVLADESQQRAAAARRILKLLVTVNDGYMQGWARGRLAALDAQEAEKKKPPAAKNSAAPRPKRNDIYSAAEEDIDEALSMVPQDPGQACRQLKGLAEHFAGSDREKSLRFVAEAIVRARNLDDPQRVLSLAELGALAVQLGDSPGGEKLVREAAGMAGKWAATEQREWQIAALAKTMARVDCAAALDMTKKIRKERRGSCLADIAVDLDDVSKVEAILRDCDGWHAGRARGRVAFRIAADRPADAVKLVEGMPADYGREELTKAAAFGWLATRIAAKDPKLAHKLIDRAYAIRFHLSDPTQYLAGERAALPALLAVHAKLAGYPDMQSVIDRVLATRLTTKNTWNPMAVEESNVATAVYLALVDRPLAREMLQAVEPDCDALGAGCCGIGVSEWIKAWALVDPSHTADLVERQFAAAKDENAKRSAWYAAREAVELWSVDPGEVLKTIAQRYINVFSPYER